MKLRKTMNLLSESQHCLCVLPLCFGFVTLPSPDQMSLVSIAVHTGTGTASSSHGSALLQGEAHALPLHGRTPVYRQSAVAGQSVAEAGRLLLHTAQFLSEQLGLALAPLELVFADLQLQGSRPESRLGLL